MPSRTSTALAMVTKVRTAPVQPAAFETGLFTAAQAAKTKTTDAAPTQAHAEPK